MIDKSNEKIALVDMVNSRVADFDILVDEVTTLLYTHFEAGGAAGNLPQLREICSVPDSWGEVGYWLVIPDKETLKHSIRDIFDSLL